MGLLRLIEGLLPPEEALRVTASRCLRRRSKSGRCDACARVCPADAVALDGEQPVSVDDERCLRCGICTAVCPTEALELPSVSAARLLERVEKARGKGAADREDLRFACTLGPARPEAVSGDALPLPCLGSLGPSVLAALALRYGRIELLVSEAGCGACRLKDQGWPALQRATREAGDILDFFGLQSTGASCCPGADVRITLPQKVPVESGERPAADSGETLTSRKEFLASLTRGATRLGASLLPSILRGDKDDAESPEARQEGAESPDAGKDGGESPADRGEDRARGRVPEGRALLLEMLRGSGAYPSAEGAPPTSEPLPERVLPFGYVQVSSACEGCDVCTRVCPAGALTKAVEGEQGVLRHEPARCLKCGTCARACPRHAIVVEEPHSPAEVFGPARIVAEFSLRTCRWCGRTFWGKEQDACQACQVKLEWARTVLPDPSAVTRAD